MSQPTYRVRTYDCESGSYTKHSDESERLDIHGVRRVLRDLRDHFGYSAEYSSHGSGDPAILVERLSE